MAGANSTIVVRVLGNTRGLSRSLRKASDNLGGLERISRGIATGMRAATVATAAFGAAALGAGVVGAAALAAVPAAIIGLGILAAAQSKRVKQAYSGLADHVVKVFTRIAAPLEPVLVRGAGLLKRAFDALVPSLRAIFRAGAPALLHLFRQMVPIARQLGPVLKTAFKAGIPVLSAFIEGIRFYLLPGLQGFFNELAKSAPAFARFAGQLMAALGALLPPIGRLLAALTPIANIILQTVIPALVSLIDWLAANVGPAFQKVSGFMREHTTVAKVVGVTLIGLVVAIKAVQVAMATAQAVMLLFTAAAKIVRAAIIVWTNAQWALNIAMTMNPIGVVIAAIVALVAIFVVAYKKSETFRRIVNKAWAGIKSATSKVWNFLKGLTLRVWNAIEAGVTSAANGARRVLSTTWNAIRSITRAAWAVIKNTILVPIRVVIAVLRGDMGKARSIISTAWNFVKSATGRAWDAVVNAVRNGVERFMGFIRGIHGKVLSALSGIGSWLLGLGEDMMRGFIDGVKNMAGALGDAAVNAVKGAVDKVKGLLKIGSPSKVMRQIGVWTGEGLVIGLKRMGRATSEAATGLAREVANGFSAPQLSLNARPAFSGAAAGGAGAAGRVYQINVEVPVTANPVEVGREVVKAVEAFEKSGGRRKA